MQLTFKFNKSFIRVNFLSYQFTIVKMINSFQDFKKVMQIKYLENIIEGKNEIFLFEMQNNRNAKIKINSKFLNIYILFIIHFSFCFNP
jgi:hypothetical protein